MGPSTVLPALSVSESLDSSLSLLGLLRGGNEGRVEGPHPLLPPQVVVWGSKLWLAGQWA
jgi:hypothetical protein